MVAELNQRNIGVCNYQFQPNRLYLGPFID